MTKPKVLFYDLETFPNIGYTWAKWEQNVIKFVKEWELASFAFKWQGDKKVTCYSRRNYSEKALVKKLYSVIDNADITIAHNGDSFDLKKAKAKFVQFGLKPPSLSKSVDTKKIAKSQFAFNSNSLNDLGETLGLGKKIDTGGFDLWLGCMNNDRASWTLMEKYNCQDVVLLEKVYNALKSWAPSHPNMAVLAGIKGCPKCGSSKIHSRGWTAAAQKLQKKYRCVACGGWFIGNYKDV